MDSGVYRGCVGATTVMGLALLMTVSTSAQAQGEPAPQAEPSQGAELEEITVTAQRRAENLQSVPVAVSIVEPDQLTTLGVRSASDLTSVVPGLKFQTNGTSRDQLTFGLRGQSVSNGTSAPAVIPYFAEVPLQTLADGQFYDISAIQVLRGPQGTLFGRVTDGGALLFSPTKPGQELEGYAQAQLGNFNLRQFEGAVSVPFGERVSLRLAGTVIRRDGFTTNLFNGRDLDNLSTESGRASLVVKLTDSLENYSIINFNHADTNGSGLILTGININDAQPFPCCNAAAMQAALAQQLAIGPRAVVEGEHGTGFDQNAGDGIFLKRHTWWAVNTTTWTVLDDLRIKNIFGFQRNKEQRGGYVGYHSFGYQLNAYIPGIDQKLFTDELQAQGELFNGRLDYTTGLYYENSRPGGPSAGAAWIFGGVVENSLTNDQFTRSRAVYAQIGYKITEALKLNAGVRRTKDDVTAHQATYTGFGVGLDQLPYGDCRTSAQGLAPGVVLSLPCTTSRAAFAVTTYTLGLDYQLSRDLFAYATLRKGYRPGGVNAAAFGELLPPYNPETNLSHEIGIKATYGTEAVALRTNVAVYYDRFKDNQQSILFVPDGDVTRAVNSIVNAPSATIEGVELDQTVRFFNAVTLNLNYAYIDAGFDKKKFGYSPAELAAACPADPLTTPPDPTRICPTNPWPLTAKHTLQAAIEYALPIHAARVGDVSVGADAYFTTKTYPAGAAAQLAATPGYTVANAHVSWTNAMSMPLDLTFFVNNLADRLYAPTGGANLIAAGSFGATSRYYAPPRMWGVSAKYRF